ncbi:MAG: YraN family protein [Gemmobacter sp.]
MTTAGSRRRAVGLTAHLSGLSAEDQVIRRYVDCGCTVLARRWRGAAGEIDAILRDETGLIFVEVKRARTHAAAAERLSPRQTVRLLRAAEEFLGTQPQGLLTAMRLDLALVDQRGRIEICAIAVSG